MAVGIYRWPITTYAGARGVKHLKLHSLLSTVYLDLNGHILMNILRPSLAVSFDIVYMSNAKISNLTVS